MANGYTSDLEHITLREVQKINKTLQNKVFLFKYVNLYFTYFHNTVYNQVQNEHTKKTE